MSSLVVTNDEVEKDVSPFYSNIKKHCKIVVVFLIMIIFIYVVYSNKESFGVMSLRSDPSVDNGWSLTKLDESITSLNSKLQ